VPSSKVPPAAGRCSCSSNLSDSPAAEQAGEELAISLVGPGADQIPNCARSLPGGCTSSCASRSKSLFYPVIDGYVLKKSPFQSFLDGDQAPLR